MRKFKNSNILKKIFKDILNILSNFLILLTFGLLVINIFFILNEIFYMDFCSFDLCYIISNKLNLFFKENTLKYLFISSSALLTFLILILRNKQLEKQSETQYKIFLGNSEFNSFLEATKLLTNQDSTVEAKISSLYLLYDIANRHNTNLDRIIQIINKNLIKLVACLDGDSKCKLIVYDSNECYNLTNYIKDGLNYKKLIKNWKYAGDDEEKLISVSLEILKNILVNIILPNNNLTKEFNLSHSIIFDLDSNYITYKKFKSNAPVENLFFLSCKLESFNFNVKYYHCSFYDCNLKGSKFKNSNLWGSYFYRCNLEKVSFKNCECEGVIFEECKNLTEQKIRSMKFEFKDKYKKNKEILGKINNLFNGVSLNSLDDFFPIVIKNNKEKIEDIYYFTETEQYEKFVRIKNELIN